MYETIREVSEITSLRVSLSLRERKQMYLVEAYRAERQVIRKHS